MNPFQLLIFILRYITLNHGHKSLEAPSLSLSLATRFSLVKPR